MAEAMKVDKVMDLKGLALPHAGCEGEQGD